MSEFLFVEIVEKNSAGRFQLLKKIEIRSVSVSTVHPCFRALAKSRASTDGSKAGHPETYRVAHLPAHLLKPPQKIMGRM